MAELHKQKIGWFVSFERDFNNFMMAIKSMMMIVMVGILATVVTAVISAQIGFWDVGFGKDFVIDFLVSTLKIAINIFHLMPSETLLWKQSGLLILKETFYLLSVHSLFGILAMYYMYISIKASTEEMSQTKYIRGTALVPEKERLAEIKKKMMDGVYKARFLICRIPFSVNAETEHIMIAANSGGGKTQLLKKVVKKIGHMQKVKGLIHDIKGDWTSENYNPQRGDLIFNPLDARSIKWTIWNDIEDIIDIKNFCAWIVPDLANAKDPFWQTSAREILESIMLYLWKHDMTTNEDVKNMINLPGDELSEKLVGFSGAEFAKKKDSLLTLKSQMAWVYFMPDGKFSIKEWVQSDNGVLFLSNKEKTEAIFRPAMTLFLNALSSTLLDLEDDRNRRFYFILDEIAAVNKIEKLIQLQKLGRSKGVSLWLAFQDFQQLEKIYGREDCRTLINNCNSCAVGRLREPDAAAYFSKRFARQEFLEKSQTTSMGVADNRDGLSFNEQRKEDFVVKDTDIINLQERQFYCQLGGLQGVTLSIADIVDAEIIAPAFVKRDLSKEDQILMVTTIQLAGFNLKTEVEKKREEAQANEELESRNEVTGYF